ncbi:unnamed protein product [Litomosoides sigmodontis]|uniref:Uncharacterized protein n=1 Tax=Litomosoides sigmodontis TaxID=42156 RepID=A0A3P6TV46_LITSI|nr:unnamed protein product [Litomosoides sigmodontis]
MHMLSIANEHKREGSCKDICSIRQTASQKKIQRSISSLMKSSVICTNVPGYAAVRSTPLGRTPREVYGLH